MTAKEKAKELIDKFYIFQDQDAEWCMLNNARTQAIVVAEEVLLELNNCHDIYENIVYWKDVLSELQKRID